MTNFVHWFALAVFEHRRRKRGVMARVPQWPACFQPVAWGQA